MVENQPRSNGRFVKRDSEQPPAIIGQSAEDVGGTTGIDNVSVERTVDPAEIDAKRAREDGSEPVGKKRGRGRPPGSGSKSGGEGEGKAQAWTSAPGKLDLDSLNFTLFYAHELIAKITRTPEIALDKDDAKTMAAAAMNVMQHYNIKASQKAIDWGNFILTTGLIYGGKFHAVHARTEAEKKARRDAKDAVTSPYNLT